MTHDLARFMALYRPAVETELERQLPLSSQRGADDFNEAVRYAVFPGGKRWRPLLTLLGAMAAGGEAAAALPAAAAMEYLHTSSLVLDDLPAMDDADVRRGRAALHVAYGESTALLVALALLNQSYALLLKACRGAAGAERLARLVGEAVECVGADGMIGGQAVDLACRERLAGRAALESRNLKTTALTRLMMAAGAIAAGASEPQVAALTKFGECLGTAYQIYDDLLDEFGESESVGKPVGQDQRHLRPSFVAELGVEGACRLAESLMGEAREAMLVEFGSRREVALLADAAEMIVGKIDRVSLVPDLVA
jgi:geranylgeranyl diphosphate synthase, type II